MNFEKGSLLETTDECVARVFSVEKNYLIVSYLSQIKKTYKGTKVFSFESAVEYLSPENISKRYNNFEEAGLIEISSDMFVEKEDIDEYSSSEIESEDDDSDSDSASSFIVPDNEEVIIKPDDYREVDEKWKSWKPVTSGAKRFKEKIDQIESYMNMQIDEKFVFKN